MALGRTLHMPSPNCRPSFMQQGTPRPLQAKKHLQHKADFACPQRAFKRFSQLLNSYSHGAEKRHRTIEVYGLPQAAEHPAGPNCGSSVRHRIASSQQVSKQGNRSTWRGVEKLYSLESCTNVQSDRNRRPGEPLRRQRCPQLVPNRRVTHRDRISNEKSASRK